MSNKTWSIEWTRKDAGDRIIINGPTSDVVLKSLVDAAESGDFISVVATRHPTDPGGLGDFDTPDFVEKIKSGSVIPFLGAGASLAVRKDPQILWKEGVWFPPSASELAEHLARLSGYRGTSPYEWKDLPRIASCYFDTQRRPQLRKKLHRIFAPLSKPTETDMEGTPQWFLANCHEPPMLIITTNYDLLLETAFANRPNFDLVVQSSAQDGNCGLLYYRRCNPIESDHWEESVLPYSKGAFGPYYLIDPQKLENVIDLDKRTVIYKMHGSVGEDETSGTYIINEEDYVGLLERGGPSMLPHALRKHMAGRNIMFLGYSLRDWNFRVILEILNRRNPNNRPLPDGADNQLAPHWAIQRNVTRADSEFWVRRHINVYDSDLTSFFHGLCETMGFLPKPNNHELGENNQGARR